MGEMFYPNVEERVAVGISDIQEPVCTQRLRRAGAVCDG